MALRKVRGYVKKNGKVVDEYKRNSYNPAKSKSTPFSYKYKQKSYLINKSNKKNKQLVAISKDTEIHFGDPKMREYPATKREDNFCARTFNQTAKGNPTRNNPDSANFWNRRITWKCQGKKGVSKR
jgi:hypothetical protein